MSNWILILGDLIFLGLMLQGRMSARRDYLGLSKQIGRTTTGVDHLITLAAQQSSVLEAAVAELPKRRNKKSKEQSS